MSRILARPALRRLCLFGLIALEPCMHALGIPHPEGLSSLAMTHLAQEA